MSQDSTPDPVSYTHLDVYKRQSFKRENCGEVHLKIGDARSLKFIDNESIDLICTHPPYANIIKYSEDIEGDLSHYDIDDFLTEMNKVAKESYSCLLYTSLMVYTV